MSQSYLYSFSINSVLKIKRTHLVETHSPLSNKLASQTYSLYRCFLPEEYFHLFWIEQDGNDGRNNQNEIREEELQYCRLTTTSATFQNKSQLLKEGGNAMWWFVKFTGNNTCQNVICSSTNNYYSILIVIVQLYTNKTNPYCIFLFFKTCSVWMTLYIQIYICNIKYYKYKRNCLLLLPDTLSLPKSIRGTYSFSVPLHSPLGIPLLLRGLTSAHGLRPSGCCAPWEKC